LRNAPSFDLTDGPRLTWVAKEFYTAFMLCSELNEVPEITRASTQTGLGKLFSNWRGGGGQRGASAFSALLTENSTGKPPPASGGGSGAGA